MRSMVGKPRRGKAHAHRHAHAHARIKSRDGPRLRASPADGASQRAARCPSVPSAVLFANPESFGGGYSVICIMLANYLAC